MHSGALVLTKLTYTRLEDNLIRHRGERGSCYGSVATQLSVTIAVTLFLLIVHADRSFCQNMRSTDTQVAFVEIELFL